MHTMSAPPPRQAAPPMQHHQQPQSMHAQPAASQGPGLFGQVRGMCFKLLTQMASTAAGVAVGSVCRPHRPALTTDGWPRP